MYTKTRKVFLAFIAAILMLSLVSAFVCLSSGFTGNAYAEDGYTEVGNAQALQTLLESDGASGGIYARLSADVEGDFTIAANTTVTIDLNGHKITGSSEQSESAPIYNNGTLTLIDTVGGGLITRTTNTWYTIYNAEGATMTLGAVAEGESAEYNYGVTVSADHTENAALVANWGELTIYAASLTGSANNTLKNEPTGKLTVYNATVTNNNGAGIAFLNYGDATVEGGAFTGYYAVANYVDETSGSESPATLTVNGGTYNGTRYALAAGSYTSANNYFKGGTVNVKGGTFNVSTTDASAYSLYLYFGAYATITGGTFNSGKYYSVYIGFGVSADRPTALVIKNGENTVPVFNGWFNSASDKITSSVSGGLYSKKLGESYIDDGSLIYTTVSGESTYYKVASETAAVADGVVATIGKTGYATLAEAIEAATAGATVVLTKDVATDVAIDVAKSITVDLGGYTLTSSAYINIWIKDGATDVTVKNGKLVNTYSGTTLFGIVYCTVSSCNLTIDDVELTEEGTNTTSYLVNFQSGDSLIISESALTSKASKGYAVYSSKSNTVKVENSTINANNGGVHLAQSNGTISSTEIVSGAYGAGALILGNENGEETETTYALVVNNSTLKITQENNGVFVLGNNGSYYGTEITVTDSYIYNVDNTAIYHPGAGVINISGETTVTGGTGIEIRAGELNISGESVSVTATGTEFSSTANGNGSTTIGAAIAIVQHTTALPIIVSLAGGEYTGVKTVYEADVQGNGADGTKEISLSISGGEYNGEVSADDLSAFVSGGTFSSMPAAEYLAEGYAPAYDEASDSYGVSSENFGEYKSAAKEAVNDYAATKGVTGDVSAIESATAVADIDAAKAAALAAIDEAFTAKAEQTKQDVYDWLEEFVDGLIPGSAEAVNGGYSAADYALASSEPEQTATVYFNAELDAKLRQVYSEENIAVIKGYYDTAITAIGNAATAAELQTAVDTFKTDVGAVAKLSDDAGNGGNDTARYVLLGVIIVILIVLIVLYLIRRKDGNGGDNKTEEKKTVDETAATETKEVADEQTVEEEASEEATEDSAPVEEMTDVESEEQTEVAAAVAVEEVAEPEAEPEEVAEETTEEAIEEVAEPEAETQPEEVAEPAEESAEEVATATAEEVAEPVAEEEATEEVAEEAIEEVAEHEEEPAREEVAERQAVEEAAQAAIGESVATDAGQTVQTVDWGALATKPYRPFAVRIEEADGQIKAYYEELKAELLGIKKVKGRVSRTCESFRRGRKLLAKIVIAGKTLKIYLALDPAEYDARIYHHKDAGAKKAYAGVPMALKIKSGRAVKKAKKLIAELAEKQ